MSKLRDDLYQMLHGFKPVKRGYKKQGQSDWYYLDPRYDGDDGRGQIDVINENSPNPRLDDILVDDMDKKIIIFGAPKETTKFAASMLSEREKYLINIFRRRVEIPGKITTVGAGQNRINLKKLRKWCKLLTFLVLICSKNKKPNP